MSRHRNVRTLDYDVEYDNCYGDFEYGKSVEEEFGVSSSVEERYMYDRDQAHHIGSYMHQSEDIQEEEEEESEDMVPASRRVRRLDSSSYTPPTLSDIDQGRLNSCLDEIRSVVGESFPEPVLIETVLQSDFNCEKALNALLSSNTKSEDDPKPQRSRRDRGRPSKKAAIIEDDENKMEENLSEATERMQLDPFTPSNIDVVSSNSTAHLSKQEFTETLDTTEKKEDLMSPSQESKASISPSEESKTPEPSTETDNRKSPVAETMKTPRAKEKHKDAVLQYQEARGEDKANINMVVIGHVDAGKSTLMGHLLYQMGAVSKKIMHKYEQESKKLGKQSFMYAWVLDETGEERSRGVTMDVGQSRFTTDTKTVTLLDAPGHKDFIPNMITGAAQADTAILVVDATKGEFETGFDSGGQTREHALLVRSLGVSQLTIALNKMDTVEWSKERFEEVKQKLRQFLMKHVGFKDSDLSFVPVSGLTGENLIKPATEAKLTEWYTGPSLIQIIDNMKPPERPLSKPFRLSVSDVYKSQGAGFCVAGKIETGMVEQGDKVLIMPQGEQAQVKGILIDEMPNPKAFAGDQVGLILVGTDMQNVGVGSVICEPANPIPVTSCCEARVVVFNTEVPITRGFPVIVYNGTISEPATISKLKSQLHRSTGQVLKQKPRFLPKHSSAIVNIQINRAIPLEPYHVARELGRFMLRSGGSTIAAGLCTKIL